MSHDQSPPNRPLEDVLAEGGEEFIRLMFAKAISDQNGPDPLNVRDWTYRDILRMPNNLKMEWLEACLSEIKSLEERHVFEYCELPKGRKAIANRWVFDIKSDGRKKARLVIKGFSQIEGIDYNEIFSPVVRFESVRVILAFAALNNWCLEALDVKTAFLYGELDEEIYMSQPQGFERKGEEQKVLRLRKAIYGLKQAALAWWKQLSDSLKLLGFTRLYSDSGIFIHQHHDDTLVVILAYVDDIMITGPNPMIVKQKKKLFMDKWECRDLGECKEFLRMRILRKNGKIYLDQTAYLQKVLVRFGMTNAKPARTPLPTGYKPEVSAILSTPDLRSRYQSVIGSLLYLMLGTRPDIAFAVTLMAKFASNPSQEHLDRALYICKYLAGTPNYALVYTGQFEEGLLAYTDAEWGSSEALKRRSTDGYFFKLAGSTISWRSHTQKTPALSSTEAEYLGVSDCGRQAAWLKNLFSELQCEIKSVPILADNQGSIFLGSNAATDKRTKHIDIRYHFIRNLVEDKKIELFFIPTEDNAADMFTKNLGPQLFERHRRQLGLEFFEKHPAL